MKKLVILIIFCIPLFLSAQLLNAPESVVYDEMNNRYLVSNVNTGNIVAIDENGNQTNFATEQPSVRGIHIRDMFLYTSGNLGVRCYSLIDGATLWTIQLPGAGFPNDITSDNNGFLYVSDNQNNIIFRVNIAAQFAETYIQGTIPSPNGLFFEEENNRLIVVSFSGNSAVRAVDLATGNVTTIINTTLSNLDGIARDSDDQYYISSWATNSVYIFSSDFSEGSEFFSNGHDGPADIYFDEVNSVLAVPNFNANTVDFITIQGEEEPDVEFETFIPAYNYADENVIITWTTASEIDVMGFNILRSESNDFDDAIVISGDLISAENSSNGANYEFIDDNINFDTEYFYWVQAIFIEGNSEEFGPEVVQIPANPNPFTITSFSGEYLDENGYIQIEWSTINETEISGYNLYRNNSNDLAQATVINNSIISANNTIEESFYQFEDENIENNSTYFYWLEIVDIDGGAFIYDQEISVSTPVGNLDDSVTLSIEKNTFAYPNPFNPQTTINFVCADESSKTKIEIFNSLGQKITTLSDEIFPIGNQSTSWNGSDSNKKKVSSGVYFFKVTNGRYITTKQITLLK